ncbi:MAG: KH domain-containing protein [Armatimonadota bacterium]
MLELVEYMVRALVDNPEQVSVREIKGQSILVYEVDVAEEDLGKVIGKNGRIANALRTIVKASAMKQQKKATVEILS